MDNSHKIEALIDSIYDAKFEAQRAHSDNDHQPDLIIALSSSFYDIVRTEFSAQVYLNPRPNLPICEFMGFKFHVDPTLENDDFKIYVNVNEAYKFINVKSKKQLSPIQDINQHGSQEKK